jgi:hypothetical protein
MEIADEQNINKVCFFCANPITSRKTLEHIISDSLLGKLGIKESTLDINASEHNNSYTYSRIKVPAHEECNSGFGSQYESKIIDLFSRSDKLFQELIEEEVSIPVVYSPDESRTSIISTWLAKIYYGLFYYDYLKSKNQKWKELSKDIIDDDNFNMIRESYKNGYGFYLPSSLFTFRISGNTEFDLKTSVFPQGILLKIGDLIFILCIGDGYLVKNYLNSSVLEKLRKFLNKLAMEQEDFPVQIYAWAEILALWLCIPKSPSLIYNRSQRRIINMSLMTLAADPQSAYAINEEQLREYRNTIISDYLDNTIES